MDGTTILIVAIPVLVILGAVTLVASSRRKDQGAATGQLKGETRKRDKSRQRRLPPPPVEGSAASGREVEMAVVAARSGDLEPRTPDAPIPWTPPDPEEIGVNRRQFFNRSITLMMIGSLSSFGAACIAFLWPTGGGGFGSVIPAGRLVDIEKFFSDNKEPVYNPEGRFYLNPYPVDAVGAAESSGVYDEAVLTGMREGVVALFQKCPHLGCRVPWCQSSQWFECPCHGSQYNRVGQKKGGPAPRGMDVMGIAVADGRVQVDTGAIFQGAPIGTDTTGQTAEGPNCLSDSGGHG